MRQLSVLIPYRKTVGGVSVFMQKRASDAKRYPGKIAFFGGHAEPHEIPEQTLVREIKEELNYDLIPISFKDAAYKFLETQQFEEDGETVVKHIYYFKVPDDFDEKITIGEGDYGQWFTQDEILAEPLVIEHDRPVLEWLFERLES